MDRSPGRGPCQAPETPRCHAPGDVSVEYRVSARPQLCVPLAGAGDAGCIGVIGALGFGRGAAAAGDAGWREWAAARAAALDAGDGPAVKQLRLVRPRRLPGAGKLEGAPDGTAAKAVFGRVERVYLKRAIPLYAVRSVPCAYDAVALRPEPPVLCALPSDAADEERNTHTSAGRWNPGHPAAGP